MNRFIAGSVFVAVVALVLSFNNCSKVEFSTGSESVTVVCSPGASSNTQGQDCPYPDSEIKEAVFTSSPKAVDILLVVDDSQSMVAELANLGTKFTNLASSLGSIDWQMCLVTTDAEGSNPGQSGKVMNWAPGLKVLNSSTPLFANVFRDRLLSIASGGSGFEQPIKNANKALQLKDSDNAGCFRAGVAKAVLIVSDEDELSDGWVSPDSALSPTALNFPQSLVDTSHSLFGVEVPLSAHAIGIKTTDASCLQAQRTQLGPYDPTTGYYATRLTELAQLTGGQVQSICESDFGPAMAQLGAGIATHISSVELNCVTAASVTSVTYTNSTHPGRTHQVVGKRLTFTPALEGTEQAQVRFTCI